MTGNLGKPRDLRCAHKDLGFVSSHTDSKAAEVRQLSIADKDLNRTINKLLAFPDDTDTNRWVEKLPLGRLLPRGMAALPG